jgi:PAS domain S-box-containing protein
LAEAINGMLAGIQERDEQFRNLFEHMTGGFMLLEVLFDSNGRPADHRLLEANSEFEQVLGLKRSEELGRTSAELSFEWPADVTQSYYKVAMGGAPVHWERFNDSLQRHYDIRVFSPRMGQFALMFNDITERKQAEVEKAKLEIQLQQSQKMESLGVLAGGVAHDMNNVLGAILGLSSAHLEMHPDNTPVHRAFTTIFKAATRGGSLVKSLLTFARQSPAEERELDVNAILREEVTLLERTTLSKIHLEMDLDDHLRPIRGDVSALTHAFMNLCVNAVDAMPDHGTLSLQTRNVDNDWIEVRVDDTGTGMSREVLEKALDPFFTTKGVGKGTGLGLSMVFSTVKAHHGQLDIQSEVGKGTHIRMRFPACASSRGVAEAIPELESMAHQRLLNVYLVEDDELFQSSTRALLELLGHTTTTASCGEEALEKLETGFRPDVVILDINMPGLGGSGTLPRLRVLWPDMPILLATGRVDQTALDLVAAHSNVTLLSKPFSIKELQFHLEAFRKAP